MAWDLNNSAGQSAAGAIFTGDLMRGGCDIVKSADTVADRITMTNPTLNLHDSTANFNRTYKTVNTGNDAAKTNSATSNIHVGIFVGCGKASAVTTSADTAVVKIHYRIRDLGGWKP